MTEPRSILLLSGPNLNLLGTREPDVYGTERLADHVQRCRAAAETAGLSLVDIQSNHEGELVEAVHRARSTHAGIIVNPGAFTHYAWGLHDALAAYDGVIVELHLSNPDRRESWRHTSVVTPVADAVISGLWGAGYAIAVTAVVELLASRDG